MLAYSTHSAIVLPSSAQFPRHGEPALFDGPKSHDCCGLMLAHTYDERRHKRADVVVFLLRFRYLASHAAREALNMSGWSARTERERDRAGVAIGSGIGSTRSLRCLFSCSDAESSSAAVVRLERRATYEVF